MQLLRTLQRHWPGWWRAWGQGNIGHDAPPTALLAGAQIPTQTPAVCVFSFHSESQPEGSHIAASSPPSGWGWGWGTENSPNTLGPWDLPIPFCRTRKSFCGLQVAVGGEGCKEGFRALTGDTFWCDGLELAPSCSQSPSLLSDPWLWRSPQQPEKWPWRGPVYTMESGKYYKSELPPSPKSQFPSTPLGGSR